MGMEKPPIHNSTTGDGKPLTTFVHTNTNAFREVVQRLTGPSESKEGEQTTKVAPPTATKDVKRTASKLHERRKCMKPKLEIVKPTFHCKPGALSPSSNKSRNSTSYPASPVSGSGNSTNHLPSPTTPSTLFSQLTLFEDEKKAVPGINIEEEEEKAIKERRFYLHPSPRSKPDGYNEPELLNLFPLASPKASEKV